MTVQPLDGFKSLETLHCITGSMRHIYAYHDHALSEDMLLGIGAGVGFMYWHQKGTPPMYGGRANFERPGVEGLEKTTGRRTGVKVESHYTGSAKKAQQSLLDILTSGEPVMLYVDMGFLPYFGVPEEYHFGGHAIVVAGYDAASEQVLIADRDSALHPISLAQLAQARGSTYKPFPPRHGWYTFDFSAKRPPTPNEVLTAIREVTQGMLQPPIANFGVQGIHTAVKRTLKWPDIMDEETLRWTCFNIHIFIDPAGGSGGGIFRYMYGRFLHEAAAITGKRQLAALGDALRDIGDRWQEVAGIFKDAHTAPKPEALLPEATKRMLAIADCEESVWTRLRDIVNPA